LKPGGATGYGTVFQITTNFRPRFRQELTTMTSATSALALSQNHQKFHKIHLFAEF
jgi:hypothetical protein